MSNFKSEVYELVKKIPKGKVMTYGLIASIINSKIHSGSVLGRDFAHSGSEIGLMARAVGNALHQNTEGSGVPCHRVVNREGRLAPNFAFDGAEEQRRRLLTEGVEFFDKSHVNLKKYLWK